MKKIPVYCFRILAGSILIILLFFCVFLMKGRRNSLGEIEALQKELTEMKSKKTTADAVKEEVKQISRYAAYEFSYTAVLCHSDKNQFMGIDIPLTGNHFVATIDGKIMIGIEGDKISFLESTDSEGMVTEINLFVPHSMILDNYVIPESLEIFDEKNNAFNPVRPEDYNGLLIEAKEQEETKIQESDILKKSDETIKYLLISHFQAVYGNSVEIKYMYINEEE